MLRRDTEQDIGMEVTRSGSGFHVSAITEFGPAWRAGACVGDFVRSYNLTDLIKPHSKWSDSTIADINAQSPDKAIGIQLRKNKTLEQPWIRRIQHFARKRVRTTVYLIQLKLSDY
jgi:predicted metalloprotease with PDZ domain